MPASIARLPEAELVAVADADGKLAEATAQRHGARAYTDYRLMLEKEKPEAVSIAVPTVLHEEVGMLALEAGAHVLMEKPIAATVEESQRLIVRAKELGRQLMVGHIVRFNPAMQALKQKLEAGEVGRIFQVFCRRAGPFPARIRDVGVVVDLAPHDVDLMRFLVGSDPVRLYAETEQRIHTEHEDLLWAILRFADGVTGSLEINWLTPTKVRETLVLGERGMFRVDDLTQDLYFYENAHAKDIAMGCTANLARCERRQHDALCHPALRTLEGRIAGLFEGHSGGTGGACFRRRRPGGAQDLTGPGSIRPATSGD